MNMGVDESRHHQAAVEIDLFGTGSGQLQDVVVFSNGQNSTVSNGYGAGKRLSGLLGGNGAVEKYEVRGVRERGHFRYVSNRKPQ